jgi:hypothetical protein
VIRHVAVRDNGALLIARGSLNLRTNRNDSI